MKLILPAFALLASCGLAEKREITDCEGQLLAKLKAPSSYKRIHADSLFMRGHKPPEVWATIEYDAVNSFNAPIRDTEICKYPATPQGEVDWGKRSGQLEIEADRVLSEANAAQAAAVDTLRGASDAAQRASEPPYPYVAPDGVDIQNAQDEANWKKYGTTTPGGE